MRYKKEKLYKLIFTLFITICCINYFSVSGAAEQKQPPSVEQLAAGEGTGWLPPSIEEFTQGKVKVGDLITKDNVDLVKDYLAPSVYACVKQGMVLRMAKNVPPEKIIPKFFWEATARHKGMAVIDENGTVRLADGSPWIGGLPFAHPETALEAMANVKFGMVMDDYECPFGPNWYVGKDGKIEKTAGTKVAMSIANGRLRVSPLGTVPGAADEQWRHIVGFTEPLEMKGMGQLTIRHYDEYKDPDEGFLYLPAFKRCIRVSAITYQDNVGGQDFTYGDPGGLREPFAYWDFKSLSRKLMLMQETKALFPWWTNEGKMNEDIQFDHGYNFPREGWMIAPMLVIEAVPNIKHIYGKKVFYTPDPPYWRSTDTISPVDIYDRQGKLWKCYLMPMDTTTRDGIDYGNMGIAIYMHDIQTGHTSINPLYVRVNAGVTYDGINLTGLLKMGR